MAEGVIADLMVVLTTKVDTAVAGFTEVGTAGEEMAAKVTAAVDELTAVAGRLDESLASVGVAAGETAAQVTKSSTAMGDSATVAAGRLEQIGLAANTAATENALAMDKMTADTAALSAKLELAAVKAEESNAAVGASFDKAAVESDKAASGQAKNMGMAAVAIAAVGAVSVDMAANYQTSTNKLVTSAGESKASIDQVRQGMLEMAGQVGVSATTLSDAMYKVESAGYHGAAGLGLLKSAEQGAKAEGADGAKVADALSSAMRDYYPHAQSAADVTKYSTDVMSKLIGATSAGKMSFDDLAGSLNSILPVSSAANISLSDTLGVLASMTVHGISADQATQNMADAIRHLQAPTQTMSKAMATLGIDSQDVAAKLGQRGLSGTMQFLSDKVKAAMPPGSSQVILDLGNAASKSSPQVQALANKVLDGSITMAQFTKEAKGLDPISAKQAQAFATLAAGFHQLGNQQMSGADVMQTYGGMMQKVMGDSTGLKVALMTTGENAQYTKDAIKQVSGATADAQGNVKGWAEVQDSFNQKLAEAKSAIGAMAIQIGNALLPILTPVIKAVADFAGWLARHPALAKAAAIAIAALTVGFIALTVAMWAASATPVMLIIAAVVAAVVVLIAVIVVVATHWSQIWRAIGDAAKAVYNAVIKPVIDAIVTAAKAVGQAFTWLYQNVLKPVFQAISVAVRFVAMVITMVLVLPVIAVVKLLGLIFGWLYHVAIKPALDAIGVAAKWLYDNAIKPVGDAIGVALHAVGGFFTWLYNNAVQPVINALAAAWNWFYANVIRPVGEAIGVAVSAVGSAFRWVWDNAIHPAIDAVSGAWHWLYDNAIKPVADWIGGVVHGVGQAFSDAFTWVKGIVADVWNFIKPIFDAIGKAVGWVMGKLSSVTNAVSGGFSSIAHMFGFADGGWVPGAPGEAMLAVVHGGEYVVSRDMQAGNATIDPKLGAQLTATGTSAGTIRPPVRAVSPAGGGGQYTNVQIIVQGSAVTERQLIDTVQRGMLQAGVHRPVTYQNYRR